MVRRVVWGCMVAVWAFGIAAFAAAGMSGQVVAWFVVASMVHALTLAVANELLAGAADDGVAIPLLYLVGGLVGPVGWPSWGGQVFIAGLMAITIAARSVLGAAFTIGGSKWLGLRDRGPYAFIRHPLIGLDVVGRFGIALAYPSALNWVAAAGYLGCMVAVIYREEAFLMQREVYRCYAARVRFRLLPGVW